MEIARLWLIGIIVTFMGTCSLVRAESWVGPDCRFVWNANPAEQLVEGYIIHIRNRGGDLVVIDTNVGNVTETTCSTHGLAQGRYDAWLTAYNPVGESLPSDTVPFVLAKDPPGSPGGVSAPDGFEIESAGAQAGP